MPNWKASLLFLLPFAGFADVTNVRVAGTTPTQAVIAYTAPDNGRCTVTVSASPAFTPPAPDVDPSLFAGADSDGRPGAIANGRTRVFVAGKRTVERDLAGQARSRALPAATQHYFKITCPSDGSTASGSFTTATIPSGLGHGEPIPVDPADNGKYLYPVLSNRTDTTVDPHTGALVRNLAMTGDLQGGGAPVMTSSGMGTMCHPSPVKASDSDKYGFHCQIQVGSGSQGLYWIGADGETRLLGFLQTGYVPNGWNPQICSSGLSHSMDRNDPNVFYCVIQTNGTRSGHVTVLKGSYAGHTIPGADADRTGAPGYTNAAGGLPNTTYTEMLADGRTLDVLMPEFDPQWTTRGACCNLYRSPSWFDGKLLLRYWNQQDYPGWFFVFDPNQTAAQQQAKFGSTAGCIDNPPVTGPAYAGRAGCITASVNTMWGPPGSGLRWMNHHSMNVLPGLTMMSMTNNPLGQSGAYYRVTATNGVAGAATPCTQSKPAGSSIADWPNASWAGGCSTIVVSGDPAVSVVRAGYPATFPAAPGDMVTAQSWSGNASVIRTEIMRLLDKGSDGNTWYVQRLWPGGSKTYTAVAAGATLDMLSPVFLTELWWDPATGATYGDTLPLTHSTHASSQYGSWALVAGEPMLAQAGGEPARLIAPSRFPVLSLGLPGWNGLRNRYAYESHPSLSVSAPPDAATFGQVVDNHPYFGDALVASSNVTLVAGQLYRIRGVNVAANYKLIQHFANSGNRAMREVSGPSVVLAADSSTQFQWCVALNAGECYAGSLPGDIYFNAPDVTSTSCVSNWTRLQTTSTVPNDICVSAAFSFSHGISLQSVKQDPFGLSFRVISNSFGKYDTDTNFWNSRTLPDGSWLFTSFAADASVKLIRIPRQEASSVNRTTYVPVSVSVGGRPGASQAMIEFGYAENGDPGTFYCTARREACVAQASAINLSQPFYFEKTEAGSISGRPCQSGCTITIPGVPGRVLYYRIVYRDSSGNVVQQRPLSAQAVP